MWCELLLNIVRKEVRISNILFSISHLSACKFLIFSGQLFTFYAVFYIVLAALFAICMKSLFWTLDEKAPKWTLSESRIGDSPGLGFRPMPVNISQGSLVWIDQKQITTIKTYTDIIDQFLKRELWKIRSLELSCNLVYIFLSIQRSKSSPT